MKQSSFDATISALDAETSALGAATSAIARSYQQYRRGVYGDIGDCRVGITPQICNRVTNHGDMSTFSKPALVSWFNHYKIFDLFKFYQFYMNKHITNAQVPTN